MNCKRNIHKLPQEVTTWQDNPVTLEKYNFVISSQCIFFTNCRLCQETARKLEIYFSKVLERLSSLKVLWLPVRKLLSRKIVNSITYGVPSILAKTGSQGSLKNTGKFGKSRELLYFGNDNIWSPEKAKLWKFSSQNKIDFIALTQDAFTK